MTPGGRAAVAALLLWGVAAGVRAQDDVPPPPPPGYGDAVEDRNEEGAPTGGADGLSAPTPRGTVAPVPPPPSYTGTTVPPTSPSASGVYGQAVPPSAEQEPVEDVDPDRRRGSEMIELYITSSFYTAFGTAYLLSLDDDLDDEEANFIVLGALLGPGATIAIDLATGGLPTGVPAAVSLGLIGGAVNGALLIATFGRDLADSDAGGFGLLTASMTVGGALGAVVGTQLRPSVADSRLVGTLAAWGLYFPIMTSLAIGEDDPATAVYLIGFNAGAALGVALAPFNDLNAGQVMLLNAGLGIGAAAGTMVGTLTSAGDLDPQHFAIGSLVGSTAGIVVTYLLVRPGDDEEAAEQAVAHGMHPFVAPTREGDGAVVGLGGVL